MIYNLQEIYSAKYECKRCHQMLAIEHFGPNSAFHWGGSKRPVSYRCRDCTNQTARERRIAIKNGTHVVKPGRALEFWLHPWDY